MVVLCTGRTADGAGRTAVSVIVYHRQTLDVDMGFSNTHVADE